MLDHRVTQLFEELPKKDISGILLLFNSVHKMK